MAGNNDSGSQQRSSFISEPHRLEELAWYICMSAISQEADVCACVCERQPPDRFQPRR